MNKVWSEDDKLFVKNNAGKMKDQDIANELSKRSGRLVSLQAVRKQRQKLGLSKKPGRGVCSLVQEKEQSQPSNPPLNDTSLGVVANVSP